MDYIIDIGLVLIAIIITAYLVPILLSIIVYSILIIAIVIIVIVLGILAVIFGLPILIWIIVSDYLLSNDNKNKNLPKV